MKTTRYSKFDEPSTRNRKTINVTTAKEEHDAAILKENNRYRKFINSMDQQLLQFGIDLYNHGYSLDDVKTDIELCVAMRDKDKDYDSDKSMFNYEGIDNVPSYQKMLMIADNYDLFMNIENGYNIAYRSALANDIISRKSK